MTENQIALASILITGLVSILNIFFTSRTTRYSAKLEREKLELTHQHEEQVEADLAYSEMIKKVISFECGTSAGPYEALEAIGALRISESGELGNALDDLYATVRNGDSEGLDAKISFVIAKRRISTRK